MSQCNDCNTVITQESSSGCEDCTSTCPSMPLSECIIVDIELENIGTSENQGLNDVLNKIDDLLEQEFISATVTIPSASLLLIYTTPYVIVSTPGANNYIEIIKVSCFMSGDLSTAYVPSSTTSLGIKSSSATNPELLCNNTAITYTDSTIISNFRYNTASNDTIRTNDDIVIYDLAGNPISGTGDLTINILYKINSI